MYCPACHADYPDDWKVCPKDTATLLKTAQIGKYAIEGLLGVGGMGAVYRAINPDTRGRVAVKVMNPDVASAEQARQRFQREAAAVAALRTAHVVKVYDFGSEPDGTLYLVMELLDGHPLRDEIRPAPDYMDLARIQLVMDGALKGLAAAHKAGIVHRDLKPENIYVADTDDGEVPKLLDFGIARVHTKDSNLTRTGHLMGTAAYMAVEQVAATSGDVGPWTDVYALGAILYEMLAGAPAYSGATVTEVLARVLSADAVPLSSVRPGLPDGLYALVARCMSSEPAERPQDAEAMRAALDAVRLVPPGTAIPPPHRTQPVSSKAPAFDRTAAPGETVGTQAPVRSSAAPARPPTGPTAVTGSATPSRTASASAVVLHEPPRRRAVWPFALAGLVAAGVVAFIVARGMRGSTAPPDAPVVIAAVPDAAAPPPPIDAAIAIDAPEMLDAAIAIDAAHRHRPDASRPPRVVDAAPPPPPACNIPDLQRQAREQLSTGQDAAALTTVEHLIRCGFSDRTVMNLAALAACRIGNADKARQYWTSVGPGRRAAIRQVCLRNGIDLR